MDNYSKVLEFFMENGITLNRNQLETLQEEFLNEAVSLVDSVKKDESKIKAEINKYLKSFFNEEKDKSVEPFEYKGKMITPADWRDTIKKAPTVYKFDYETPDFPMIELSYAGSSDTWHDHMLFFEDDFVRYLRKQNGSILNKYYFYDEDYPGLIIGLKKK